MSAVQVVQCCRVHRSRREVSATGCTARPRPAHRPAALPRVPSPRSQDLTCFDVRCPLATMQNSWLAREVASSPSLSRYSAFDDESIIFYNEDKVAAQLSETVPSIKQNPANMKMMVVKAKEVQDVMFV
ncbi:unnamed protein product [Spodoptera exigua]|nr:unnamed protein product [Spodoptera exigua]